MDKEFNIKSVMEEVQKIRTGFTLEGDFQFTLGLAIYKKYKNKVNVIMEYKYPEEALLQKNAKQYIDILVIMNNKWYPIELKYKHSKCDVVFFSDSESIYALENQSCRKNHRQAYVNDIKRLLKCRSTTIFDCKKNEKIKFGEGYAILLTNYGNFKTKEYSECSLNKNEKGIEEIKDYKFNKDYNMEWFDYKPTDNKDIKKSNFSYLITTIKNEK